VAVSYWSNNCGSTFSMRSGIPASGEGHGRLRGGMSGRLTSLRERTSPMTSKTRSARTARIWSSFSRSRGEDAAFDDVLTFLRLGGNKVEGVTVALLANAVDATEALFQAGWDSTGGRN